MSHQILSYKKAQALYLTLFLIGLGVIAWKHYWWPGIIPVFGIALMARQFCLGKRYDMWVSLCIFGGAYLWTFFPRLPWEVFLPIALIVSGLYIFARDFLDLGSRNNDDNTP